MSVELSDIETLNCGRVRTAAVAAMKGLMYGITDPELEQITNITLQVCLKARRTLFLMLSV